MRRKQVYLSVRQEYAIREIAHERGVPEAVVIREALDAYLAEERAVYDEAPPLADLHVIGSVNEPGLPKDGSTTYKRDLYGRPGGPL